MTDAMGRFARLLIGLTTLTALILMPAGNAWACSCASSGPPCQSVFQVDAVFAGTVKSLSALPDNGPPLRPGETRSPQTLHVEFTAVVAFRGNQATTTSVETASSGPACGYAFKPGERYLVYASRNPDGAGLVTSICSRTRLLWDASDDLQFLQTLSRPSTTRARVSGTITHWERDLVTNQPREYDPVSDVLVAVRGVGSAYDTWTDSQGRYELTLPPGKYYVTAVPPAGFSIRHLEQTIELPDVRACFVVDFGVQFDGRIKGVVKLSSGEPAAGVPIDLVAAEAVDKSGYVETLHASSDAGGSFEFIEVPPGEYVVGVDLTRRMDAEVVFPRTFYPGTRDVAVATVVQLDGGQQAELEPMTLPPARPSHRITGRVVFADGTPASDAFISLVDGIATWRQVAAGIKPEFDGTFSFVVHEGLSYIARASYWDESQQRQIRGSAGPFVVTRNVEPLTIVLSASR